MDSIRLNASQSKEHRPATRFSQISAPRQLLVLLCQTISYGYIHHLEIADSEPVFTPPPVVLIETKLDGRDQERSGLRLNDFPLGAEVRRLLDRLDELKNVTVERIDVRAGVPCRLVTSHSPKGLLP
jgi:hypothetical protein